MPLARTPKGATAPLSARASDTFPAPASLVTETRSGRRLAYPAGEGSAMILPGMASKSRRVRWLSANSSQ